MLALSLCILVIVGWTYFMRNYSIVSRGAPPPTVPRTPAPAFPEASPAAPRSAQPLARLPARRAAPRRPEVPDRPETLILVENESVQAVVSSVGGRLQSWQLKGYRATGTTRYEELIPLRAERLGQRGGYEGPLCVRLSDFPLSTTWPATASLTQLRVTQDEISRRLPDGKDETVIVYAGDLPAVGELVLTQELPQGRTLVKRLSWPATGHLIDLVIELTGPLPEFLEVLWYPGVGYAPNEEEAMNIQPTFWNVASAVLISDDRHQVAESTKVREPQEYRNPFWVAVTNKYFVAALIPPPLDEMEGVSAVSGVLESKGTLRQKGFINRQTLSADNLLASLKFTLQESANRVRIPLRVYIGPQNYDILTEVGARMHKVIDLGFFGFIALPLMKILKFFADFVHNYGVAIILLTLLVKVALWVPSQWGMKQMKRMQALKPQMDFINAQYKEDPKRKQEEMMRIYRENKVNPVSGCLPILLQIPIFFALYTVLRTSVELRGAPFMFWIQDLSTKDPLYVMPLLVGATMWLQQSMMPVMGDPAQAKMMRWMMPIMLTVMFINMPSGFMLYFLVQNLTQIGQQWYTNRQPAQVGTGRT